MKSVKNIPPNYNDKNYNDKNYKQLVKEYWINCNKKERLIPSFLLAYS